jgi:hypothetical protein
VEESHPFPYVWPEAAGIQNSVHATLPPGQLVFFVVVVIYLSIYLIFLLFICAYNVWVISPPFPPFPLTILPLSLILLKRAYKQ